MMVNTTNNGGNMDKKVADVYETTDYSAFKRLKGNRKVSKARIRKIMESIADGYVLNPIVVNENKEIIDGQGRLEAERELGLPVHYVIVEGAGLDDCVRMNISGTNWTTEDYVNSYAEQGIWEYVQLLDLKDEFPKLTVIMIAAILMNRIINSGGMSTVLREERLCYSPFSVKQNRPVFELLHERESYIRQNKTDARIVFTAVAWILNNTECKMDRVDKLITERLPEIVCSNNAIDFLTAFQAQYNKGLGKSNKVYFVDAYRQELDQR